MAEYAKGGAGSLASAGRARRLKMWADEASRLSPEGLLDAPDLLELFGYLGVVDPAINPALALKQMDAIANGAELTTEQHAFLNKVMPLRIFYRNADAELPLRERITLTAGMPIFPRDRGGQVIGDKVKASKDLIWSD